MQLEHNTYSVNYTLCNIKIYAFKIEFCYVHLQTDNGVYVFGAFYLFEAQTRKRVSVEV